MVKIPLVTEELLEGLSRSQIISVVMDLQRICLVQDDQLSIMQKLVDVQEEAIELYRGHVSGSDA